MQDIHVQKILAESVAVCESYIHFYELNKTKDWNLYLNKVNINIKKYIKFNIKYN